MPPVAGFLGVLGATILGGVGATALAASFGVSVLIGSLAFATISYGVVRTFKNALDPGDLGRSPSYEIAVRGTQEPRMIVYGQARVGGVIAFANSAGTEQRHLYIAVVHTGHEIEEFVGWYIDDKYVDATDVDTAGDGSVDGDTASTGHGLVPFSSTPVCYLRGHLGTAGQTVDTLLDAAFTEWTSDHRFRGCAYTVLRADLIEGAEDRWDGAAPNNVSAVVKGKKVYDPRLDSTFVGAVYGSGSGAHRVNTPSTWEWSDNPALCTADYMIDSDLGPAWATARVDYDSVAVAADQCDELVDIPTAATQKRFTCNGVLSPASTHVENLDSLLSSMVGNLRYFGGQWHVYANMYEAPVMAFDEDDLIGPLSFKAEPDRDDRYNLVKGSYVDPDREYKLSPFIEVSSALKSARDNNRELTKELALPTTNNEYQAQRLAFRVSQQAGNTGIVVLQLGYQALNLRVGDLFTVTHDELGWSDKVFRVVSFKHIDFKGVELVGKEDSEAAYDDPEEGDYGTRTAAGEITFPRISPALVDTVYITPEAATRVFQADDASPAAVSVPNGVSSARDWLLYAEVTDLESTDVIEVVAHLTAAITAIGTDPLATIAASHGSTTPTTSGLGFVKDDDFVADEPVAVVGTFTGITGTRRFGVDVNIAHDSAGTTSTLTAFNVELQVTVVRR